MMLALSTQKYISNCGLLSFPIQTEGPILKLSLKIGSKRIHAHMSYDGGVANYSKPIMIVLISGQNTCLTL